MARGVLQRARDGRAVRRALRQVLARYPELAGARIGRLLLASPERAVLSGRLGARAVVFKLILERDHAVAATEAFRDGLARHWPRMQAGLFRVPEPLFFAPADGLAVTALVPGQRLTEALAAMPPAGQERLAGLATDWLAQFTAEPRRTGSFAPDFWIDTLAARRVRTAEPEDRARQDRLIATLRAQRAATSGAPVTQVRPHGDYWSHNLIWDGAVLTGLDFGTAGWSTLGWDIARFITHLSLIHPAPQGPWRHGLAERWVAAVEARPLLRGEPPTLLRFLIGMELSHRLVTEARFPRIQREVRAAMDRYTGAAGLPPASGAPCPGRPRGPARRRRGGTPLACFRGP